LPASPHYNPERMSSQYSYSEIAKMIDHSLLNPSFTAPELESGCDVARRYGVASVCVLPYYLRRCAELLRGSGVEPSTTVGFPHGGQMTVVKLAEVEQALRDGGTELDMVINISKARSGDWDYVYKDIAEVAGATQSGGAKIKVIFENAYLDDATKIHLCKICGEIGVDWVKTSTGYAPTGATVADVRLMRKYSPDRVQVKAAGGVRTLDALLEMRAAGATRIGASQTVAMLGECRQRLGMAALAS
jgi:deoxyribose-phosphate aldolase